MAEDAAGDFRGDRPIVFGITQQLKGRLWKIGYFRRLRQELVRIEIAPTYFELNRGKNRKPVAHYLKQGSKLENHPRHGIAPVVVDVCQEEERKP